MTTLVSELRPGDIVRGTVHECPCCGVQFIGSVHAVYCSTNCRVKMHRKKPETAKG